jgi:2-polyprenyl-3-methyl-5-hydroxy-6-metoxy-1,4-benzoquinol methylase
MLSHYHASFDVDDENNSHAVMLRMVGFNKRVLEAGCASGHVSEQLHAQGCRIVGVEIDPDVVEPALPWLERVIIGDFEGDSVWPQLEGEFFDAVLFGDVLEHLKDPLATLRESVAHLAPAGVVVISIPNIAHADVKLALLNGTFPYSESGLLDRTHVSFFTKESLLQLVKEAGLAVVELARVTAAVFHTEIEIDRERVEDDVLSAVLADRESETYQFVLKAVRDDGEHALATLSSDVVELTDRLYDEAQRNKVLEAEVTELTLKVEALEIQRESDANDLAHYRRQTDAVKRLLPTSVVQFVRRVLSRS